MSDFETPTNTSEHVGPCSTSNCDNIMRWVGEWDESVCDECRGEQERADTDQVADR